ncbi:MAG: type IV pilin, partial [Thermoplasmata archaeon]
MWMKANRKFIGEERAVSAVIGVILMVAITVAIAATVYLYVSGMITGGSSVTPTVS